MRISTSVIGRGRRGHPRGLHHPRDRHRRPHPRPPPPRSPPPPPPGPPPPPPPRPPPPLPPPPPPPPPPSRRSWAGFTRRGRPTSIWPFMASAAVRASPSDAYSTKPKPRERPVS